MDLAPLGTGFAVHNRRERQGLPRLDFPKLEHDARAASKKEAN